MLSQSTHTSIFYVQGLIPEPIWLEERSNSAPSRDKHSPLFWHANYAAPAPSGRSRAARKLGREASQSSNDTLVKLTSSDGQPSLISTQYNKKNHSSVGKTINDDESLLGILSRTMEVKHQRRKKKRDTTGAHEARASPVAAN